MALSSVKFLNETSDLHAKMMEHGSRNFESSNDAVGIRHLYKNRRFE